MILIYILGALSPRSNDDMDTDSEAMMEPVEMPSKKVSLKRLADTEAGDLKRSKNDNSFLYAESKRARMEREKEEKKRRAQEIEFSAQDLALATVPGMEFDPRQRAFAPDELRPQPIIRKRKKVYDVSIITYIVLNKDGGNLKIMILQCQWYTNQ